MVHESIKAADALAEEGVDVELIDLRSVKPMDAELIVKSVMKTGRLVVADGGWKSFGLSAEVAAIASERAFAFLKAPVRRLALPDCPAPASSVLEKEYYKNSQDIIETVKHVMK
jgi:pyruvate/2-oxoglutarate/acetoin dehydrogenase E1 component